MDLIDTLVAIYGSSQRLVAVADENMQIIWQNKPADLSDFSSCKLRLFDAQRSEVVLPLEDPVTAEFNGAFTGALTVEISVIQHSEKARYVLQFYSCDDIEKLSDRSEHLKIRTNYLGNIRNELSQLIGLLDSNRQKYAKAGDIDYIRFDSDARYRILKTFSATVNISELSRYYSGGHKNDVMSISDILNELCGEIGELFEKGGCKFEADIQPSVYLRTNADRLRAAVCNLLINAFIYNKADKRCCIVKLTSDETQICLSIEDNGGQVSQQTLESFKKPFSSFRGYAQRESLGIAIAELYCNSLGGKLEFTCVEDRFTRAQMKIPAQPGCTPHKFRVYNSVSFTSPYDLLYCILAKGLDPMK